MNKRQYCESRESIAYYSGLNGLEIKGIEYGIDDYIYCVSGAWGGGKAFIRYETWAQGIANCFCNITVKPYKGRKYNPAFVWVCVG